MANLICSSIHENSLRTLTAVNIFSVLDFIEADVDKIVLNSDLDTETVLSLKHQFVTEYSARPVKGDEIYLTHKEKYFIKTHILGLDSLLEGGGLKRGALLELCGPVGCGKTQICLSLAVNAAAADSSIRIDYIDTKLDFSATRCNNLLPANLPGKDMDRILENIHVHQPKNIYDLISTLRWIKNIYEKSSSYDRIIIVDSLTAPYLPLVGISSNKGLSLLNYIASSLKELAVRHSAAVVLTNLGVRHFEGEEEEQSAAASRQKQQDIIKPLLGKYWVHVPNTRLLLSRESPQSTSRTIWVHKSEGIPLTKTSEISITENKVT